MDGVFIGLHTSGCTSSRFLVVQIPPSIRNGRLACSPSTHLSHANESLRRSHVYPAHHVFKHFHTICVEMPQPFVPKLQRMRVPIGLRQNFCFDPIHHIRIQLVQVGFQQYNNQHITILWPHHAFQRVKMQLQTLQNRLAHRKQVGLHFFT